VEQCFCVFTIVYFFDSQHHDYFQFWLFKYKNKRVLQEIYLANIPHDSLLKELGFNDFSDCVGTRLEGTD